MSRKNLKLFISYSWDNLEHENWVIDLANKLLLNGIDVILDKYELKLGNDLIHFMESSVQKADKVLLILTPNYKLKAENRKGGVGVEFSIISSKFIKKRIKNVKYIPVLRAGSIDKSVPANFGSSLLLDMCNDKIFEEKFEYLLREIYSEPKLRKPVLGVRPKFEDSKDSALEFHCLRRKVVLSLLDKTGERALCQDEMKLRVLKDREYYEDVFSSDSSLVSEIFTKPGIQEGSRNDNGKLIVRTKLDRLYKVGEILDYYSSCIYHNCHDDIHSYFSIWSEYQMEDLEIIVCFPDDRVYNGFKGFKKSSVSDRISSTLRDSVEEISYLGKPALGLKVTGLNLYDKYSIEWTW